LVKDDKLFVKLLTVRLKQSGYELVGDAPSREEALQQVELLRPDLVLMDMGLSGRLDGIDTAERIRVGCGIPVIFLTANDDQDDLQRAKHTEPFAYFTKPLRQQDLPDFIIERESRLFSTFVDNLNECLFTLPGGLVQLSSGRERGHTALQPFRGQYAGHQLC
jgi:CheY-like chemotaxis protein